MTSNKTADATEQRPFTPEFYGSARWEAEHQTASVKSEDWAKRLLTSLAVGNAAGLVAMASTLPESGQLLDWQVRASQAFALGTFTAAIAMICRERYFSALAYRYAWLAREPERFSGDIKALLVWMDRPWWRQMSRPKTHVDGVDPQHPALTGHWWSRRWDVMGNGAALLSAAAFVVALVVSLWIPRA